ncbi:hypothetical protein WME76_25835 [Sorangium sp. So ce119]|uniref:hypothetical protein n=1 Tax=Sorangium sp. So ce119 TaxID=3133279 RepID=UPI003F61EB1D
MGDRVGELSIHGFDPEPGDAGPPGAAQVALVARDGVPGDKAMRRSLHIPITAVLLLLSCPAPARAEPLPRRPPPTRPEQEMLDEAKRLVDQGRIADARDIHLTLWRLTRSASDAFRVGMLSFRLREFPMAAEFLSIYFEMVGTPEAPRIWVPPGFKEGYELARANFAEARRHVGAIEVRVNEPGAAVLVDGRQLGVSPLPRPVYVAPGQHRVGAQLAGQRVEEPVAVDAGGERTVWLVLRRAAAEAPVRLPTSKAAARSSAAPPRPARDPALRWWTVGGLAAASVALGVAGGAAVAEANDAGGERDAAFVRARWEVFRCRPGLPACDAYAEADGRARTFTALSAGAFVAAGLAAGGAVAAGFLLAPETSVRVGAVGTAPGAVLSFGW